MLLRPYPRLRIYRLLVLVPLLALVLGCGRDLAPAPARISVVGGDVQTACNGAPCEKPVVVEVLSAPGRGLLGGRGESSPVAGVRVRFEPADSRSGLLVLGEPDVLTDAAGCARVKIRPGSCFGDQYLRIHLPDYPGLETVARVVSGLTVTGGGQEAVAGEWLPRPLAVRVSLPDGGPAEGVPVHFRLVRSPGKGAVLKPGECVTNGDGVATCELKTAPWATGRYELVAEVAAPGRGMTARGVTISAMAMTRTGLVVGVLGGLALFLYGMTLMSEGLQRVAGNRLRTILQFFTRNRFAAVGAGVVVTGLIQSSSACTVMVVGFVNAGLLSLQQAIGIIYGAAIGTTVTGQMVSLKLDVLALPAIALGVVVRLVARRGVWRDWALTVLGFGLLFLGMTMMSHELKAIAGFPSFMRVFSLFDCSPAPGATMPLGAVLGAVAIGTLMTVVVQSSSATIGLAIALANSGLINFWTAIPLILGDNIGTTITALLASIGANRRAHQAALAHTVFKAIGALYMVLLLYITVDGVPIFLWIVDRLTAGNALGTPAVNVGRHIAAAHTLFNVVNVLVFLPFVKGLARLSELILPADDEEEVEVTPLEPHLLHTPSLALQQAATAVAGLTEGAWRLVADTYAEVGRKASKRLEPLRRRRLDLVRLQQDITKYLVELTERQLTGDQAQAVPMLLHCLGEAERVADHAIAVLDLAVELQESKEGLSDRVQRELDGLFQLLQELAEKTLTCLRTGCRNSAQEAAELERRLAEVCRNARKSDAKRLRKGKLAVAAGILYVDILARLEHIGAHLRNMADHAPDCHRALRES